MKNEVKNVEKSYGLTYVADAFNGCFTFISVESTISVFIEKFGNNEVSIADDTITIEIKADIWDKFSLPVAL